MFYLSGSLVTVAWCKTSTDFVRETSDHDESTISTYDSLSLEHPFVAMFSPSVRDSVDFREDGIRVSIYAGPLHVFSLSF